jgi:hypothetical protein
VFFFLACIVAAIWSALLRLTASGSERDPNVHRAGGRGSVWIAPVAGGALGFAAGVTPFLLTYVPVHSARGGVTEQQILFFSENWRGLLAVGADNFVWGGPLRHLQAAAPPGVYQSQYGLTPVLLLATVIGAGWAALRLRSGGGDRNRVRFGLVLALTALTLTLLPVRIDGKPPWLLLWMLPGFDAIRAIDRLGVVAGALAALALVALASELWERPPLRWRSRPSRAGVGRVCLAGVLALVIVEQLNTADVSRVYRTADNRLMAAVPRPPASCRWFYLVDTDRVDQLNATLPFLYPGSPIAQADAMLIGQRYRMATLNGYTGGAPGDWHLDPVGGANYEAAVRDWIQARRPGPGGCRLDLAAPSWGANP